MKTACISLEGVLAPCLWEEIGKVATIPALLSCDTHFSCEQEALMRARIALLRQHKIGIEDLHFITSMFCPLRGASSFVRSLRREFRIVILSELPAELAAHFTAAFDDVELICPDLTVSQEGYLQADSLAPDFKEAAIVSINQAGSRTLAIGHLPGDLPMLRKAGAGMLYRPASATRMAAADLDSVDTYRDIMVRHLSFPVGGLYRQKAGLESGACGRHGMVSGLLS